MNKTINNQDNHDEEFSFDTLIDYIKDNILGLSLLALALLIIIFVDYITRINAMIFSANAPMVLPTVIPGTLPLMQLNKLNKMRKFRKR